MIACSIHGHDCRGPTHVATKEEKRLFLCEPVVQWHRRQGFDVERTVPERDLNHA